MSETQKQRLAANGVVMPEPAAVQVAEDVNPEQIESGCVLYPGVRLQGSGTLIRSGARVGVDGPAVLADCALGRDATIGSGSFSGCVLLDGASFGPSGHGRAGTLFEEGASAAHAVGTKQTILFPWATMGSNINGCDMLLAGGTGPKDHSEVGSGFIHFNFTPFGPVGDKVTASRFGCVPRGVWLSERRIFLGGAGGIVGPLTIGYGTVLAAGSVYRRDRGEDVLVVGESLPARELKFDPLLVRRGAQRVLKSLEYQAQLVALHRWYAEVRMRVAGPDRLQRSLMEAAMAALEGALKERVKQLERFVGGFEESVHRLKALGHDGEAGDLARIQEGLSAAAPTLCDPLAVEDTHRPSRAALMNALPAGGGDYVTWVRECDDATRERGQAYLESVVDGYLAHPEGAARLSS